MSLRRRLNLWVYGVPLVMATAFYLPGIFFKFWLFDAGLYAAVSLRMARTGEWWTPMQANATYFNKPPLAFWVHALFVRVLGEADWVLRLPDMLSALACIALITSIAKRLHGPRIGLLAGLLLALTAEYVWRISRFRLDFMHTALMLAAVRMCVAGVMSGKGGQAATGTSEKRMGAWSAWWIAGAGVPVGLAMLVKPMFGLLALALAGVWMLIADRGTRRLAKWIPVSMIVAVVVAAPWHISMWMIHGRAFAERFFIHETTMRATGERFGAEPWWWYFAYFLNANDGEKALWFESFAVLYWPVLVFALLGVAWMLTGRKLAPRLSKRGGVLAQVYTFGLLIALSAFSDKKGWYLFPVYPGVAWIAALWVGRIVPRAGLRWVWRVSGVAAAAMLIATLTLDLSFERSKKARPLDTRALREFIAQHPEGDYWNGSLWRYESAPIYIRTGVWPKLIEDPNTGERWEPPVGSYVLYDKQRQPLPDPADEVVADSNRFMMVRRVGEGKLPREGAEQ